MFSEESKVFNCILVAGNKVFNKEESSFVSHSLEELSSLAYTLGLNVIDKTILNLKK